MNDCKLELFWSEIPVGRENAITRQELCAMWDMDDRQVRKVMQELSLFDNGDDYILIRSGKGKGFYRTEEPADIASYRKECIKKGKAHFAPLRKINRYQCRANEH